jgi:DNA polymerase-4
MDAFFAAVEVKEQPSLAGRAVVVGGTGKRGVVAAASYEARAFGVRSAMPSGQARRLCPQAVFLPGNFDLYHRYSRQLHDVLESFSPVVEGIGLDEAFLDVRGCAALFGTPLEIALRVRERVESELGLRCSVGAGPNKLVAKLASKAAKPRASKQGIVPGRGVVVVGPEEVLGFIWPMPVEALWGVGPASGARLRKLGVTTVRELAALPAGAVETALGQTVGHLVHELAWGRDPRPVEAGRPVKSIGHEETYPTDLSDGDELRRQVTRMADAVASRVRHNGSAARTVTLKVRYGDFTTLTRSRTFPSPQASGPVLAKAATALLRALDLRSGIRLLGVSASGLVPSAAVPGEQLELQLGDGAGVAGGAGAVAAGGAGAGRSGGDGAAWRTGTGAGAVRGEQHGGAQGVSRQRAGAHGARGERAGGAETSGDRASWDRASRDRASWDRASEAVDAVRARFGDAAVGPAVLLETDGLRPKRQGDSQWGPGEPPRSGPGREPGGRAGGLRRRRAPPTAKDQ